MLNKKKIEKTGDYIGITSTGKTYRVFQYTEFLNATTVSDTEIKWQPGMLIYRLPDGDPLNHLEGETYEIVRTKEKVTLTRT